MRAKAASLLLQRYWECPCTHLLHRLHGWWWVLVAAEVNDNPGNITEEGNWDRWADKRQQGLDHTQRNDIIPALRPITWPKPATLVSRSLETRAHVKQRPETHQWCFLKPKQPVHTRSGEESVTVAGTGALHLETERKMGGFRSKISFHE